MKKLLLLLTVFSTLILTGCATTESRIEDVLQDYEDFANALFKGEATDIEGNCKKVFASINAKTCIEEASYATEDDFPYMLVVDVELISYKEYIGEYKGYTEVYFITFSITTSEKMSEESNVEEFTYEDTTLVVKEDGEFKLVMYYDSEEE